MNQMIKYEVGQAFPLNVPAGSGDLARAHLVGASFDIHYFADGAGADDVRIFRNALLRLSICVIESIPFIAVGFAGYDWTFDVTLDVTKSSEEVITRFHKPGNAVNLFLVDRASGKLLAARLIGLPVAAEELIKQICIEQRGRYTDPAELGKVTQEAYARYSTEQLIAAGRTFEFKRY